MIALSSLFYFPMKKFLKCLLITLISFSCNRAAESNTADKNIDVSVNQDTIPPPTSGHSKQIPYEGDYHKRITEVKPHELVEFAKTLSGIPYKYASSDPSAGFDCSGFITYVFNHFNIGVPRSSVDFTNVGKEVDVRSAKEGDLILFTGTVDSIRIVGHMGIVTENTDTLKFIHSTSGKAYGVTISPLNSRYQSRFVKVIRVFSN